MTHHRSYVLIGRGQAGWHADGLEDGNSFSSSGGSLEDYLSEAKDGTPIYDADQADVEAFIKLVIGGPMVKADLPPGTVKRFADRQAMAAMLPALGGSFKVIAKMNLAGLSSLDYVATDVYLTLLKEQVPGIKIGKVQSGQVVWD